MENIFFCLRLIYSKIVFIFQILHVRKIIFPRNWARLWDKLADIVCVMVSDTAEPCIDNDNNEETWAYSRDLDDRNINCLRTRNVSASVCELCPVAKAWWYPLDYVLIQSILCKLSDLFCAVYSVKSFGEVSQHVPHIIYLLFSSNFDILWVGITSSASVQSEGLKVNSSYLLIRWYKTILSTSLDRIGVTEIGLRSLSPSSWLLFGLE